MQNILNFNLNKIKIGFVEGFLFLVLSVFSSWTLAYHIVLLTRLPALLIPVLMIILITLFLFCLMKASAGWLWSFRIRGSNLFLCIFVVIVSLVSVLNLRPDGDDIEFFHRAYLQSFHIHDAVYNTETLLNHANLPPISILHITTSYEYFAVFVAKITFLDPVIVYQNVMGYIVSIITLITYYFLFRTLGLSKTTAIASMILTFLFLLLDGNTHRSYGNVSFVRMWQGKTILWTALIPMSFLAALRFIRTKSYFYFFCLIMLSICAVGLSNSGVFLYPVLILAITIAYIGKVVFLDKAKPTRETWQISTWIMLGSFYCSFFAFLVVSGIFQKPKDQFAWIYGWPSNWFDNFFLAFGDYYTLGRSVVAVFIIPLLALPLRKAISVIFFSVGLILLCFNPISGSILMKVVLPGSYWRFVYLLPVPMCIGLLANAPLLLKLDRHKKKSLLRITALLISIIFILGTFHTTSLFSKQVTFKKPFDYKFNAEVIKSAQNINNVLENHLNLLMPEELIEVLPLINPKVRLEAGRSSSVKHYFIEYADPKEGERRQNAKVFLEIGEPAYLDDFNRSILSDVNGIIVRKNNVDLIQRTLAQSNDLWYVAYVDERFTVFLR